MTPPSNPIRFNARFRGARGSRFRDARRLGELENLRYYGMREALALDLAMPTRMVIERLRIWLALSRDERDAITHTPILRRHAWRME